jgi:transposase-like protein
MTSTTSTTTATAIILKTDTKGRVLTPSADREALLDAFAQSGMSGAAFARLHGIRYTTFAYWRYARRQRRKAEPAKARFHEVMIDPAAPADPVLTIELPGGGRFRLERADQLPMAKALLRYLEG